MRTYVDWRDWPISFTGTAAQCLRLSVEVVSGLVCGDCRARFLMEWWVLCAHYFSLVETKALHARLWFCHSCEWLRLAVSFRPVSACALGFAFLGIPVCLTAVWNPAGGFRSAVGRRLYPEPRQVVVSFHCSHISFALPDPIQGQSATSLRTDDLFYPATARGGLVFTQPCLLQELRSDRRSAHPMPFCLAWVNSSQ